MATRKAPRSRPRRAARTRGQATRPARHAGKRSTAPAPSQTTRTALPRAPTSAGSGPFAAARGRVDLTGITAANVCIDPDLTEGHPGYEESGESEIIPAKRLRRAKRS
jgi:hypothetical protein